jgi:hypothetical protein
LRQPQPVIERITQATSRGTGQAGLSRDVGLRRYARRNHVVGSEQIGERDVGWPSQRHLDVDRKVAGARVLSPAVIALAAMLPARMLLAQWAAHCPEGQYCRHLAAPTRLDRAYAEIDAIENELHLISFRCG